MTLLCAIGLCATPSFAATEHPFTQGISIEYELLPNEPQVFSNVFFWEIKAVCTIISNTPDNKISIKMLRKTGSVNGVPLTTDEITYLTGQPGDKLYITAPSGAKVELTNLGAQSIKTSCTAG
jgi:hypothetical protein